MRPLAEPHQAIFFVGDRPHIIEEGAYDIFATCEEQTDENGLASFRIAIGNDTNSVVEVGLSKIAVVTGLNEPIPVLSREAALEMVAKKAESLHNMARNLYDIEMNKAKVNPTLRELVNAPGAQSSEERNRDEMTGISAHGVAPEREQKMERIKKATEDVYKQIRLSEAHSIQLINAQYLESTNLLPGSAEEGIFFVKMPKAPPEKVVLKVVVAEQVYTFNFEVLLDDSS